MHDAPPAAPAPDDHGLTGYLSAAAAGDRAARDELFARAQGRLDRLARRMLRRHPAVGRWADAGDVVANASIRLLRALDGLPLADSRAFYNLAAAVIRRELIDLARHFHGPHGVGANHDSVAPRADGRPAADPPAADPDPADLLRWSLLHEAAERLPADEREVFGLTFYHGWTQGQIAGLFGIDERTVRRRLRRAAEALHAATGGDLPGDDRPPPVV